MRRERQPPGATAMSCFNKWVQGEACCGDAVLDGWFGLASHRMSTPIRILGS